ncbi:hypothetical protein PHAVU_010G019400, partial [Phaseolus vulgaris]
MAVIVVTVWMVNMRNNVRKSEKDVEGLKDWQYEVVPIDGGIGPESFAFDPDGEGPYTGVSDGRIIKWQRSHNRWVIGTCSCITRHMFNFKFGFCYSFLMHKFLWI